MNPANPSENKLIAQNTGGGWSVLDWSTDDRTFNPANPAQQVATIAALQQLEARIERMGNVRLTLEQTLLDLSRPAHP